jgi:hypothetical protein
MDNKKKLEAEIEILLFRLEKFIIDLKIATDNINKIDELIKAADKRLEDMDDN